MAYFSDKEHYHSGERLSLHVPINVWNGIAMLVNGLIGNNNFAKDFPRQCPDGNGVYGVDEHSFYTTAKSVIPTINFLPEYGNIETLPRCGECSGRDTLCRICNPTHIIIIRICNSF